MRTTRRNRAEWRGALRATLLCLVFLIASFAVAATPAAAPPSRAFGTVTPSKSPPVYIDYESGYVRCSWSSLYYSSRGEALGEPTIVCSIAGVKYWSDLRSTSGTYALQWSAYEIPAGTYTYSITYSTGWDRRANDYIYVYKSGTMVVQASVRILGVLVDANTVAGNQATVSWTTIPTTACDRFGYRAVGSPTYKVFNMQCGTHTIVLAPPGDTLVTRQRYEFYIDSSAPGYLDAPRYSGMFTVTDASVSAAAEIYRLPYSLGSLTCSLSYSPKAMMAGDAEYNPDVPNGAVPMYVWTHMDAVGNYCDPIQTSFAGMRHLKIELYVIDDTKSFTSSDLWIAGADIVPKDATTAMSGTVSFSISLGAGVEVGPVNFGVSVGINPGQGVFDQRVTVPSPSNAVRQGMVYAGSIDVEWNPWRSMGLDALFWLNVRNSLAQNHYLDKLRFMAVYTMTFSLALCQLPNTFCVWGGGQTPSMAITLGDWVVPPEATAGSVDSWADLQRGTQVLSPGWP